MWYACPLGRNLPAALAAKSMNSKGTISAFGASTSSLSSHMSMTYAKIAAMCDSSDTGTECKFPMMGQGKQI